MSSMFWPGLSGSRERFVLVWQGATNSLSQPSPGETVAVEWVGLLGWTALQPAAFQNFHFKVPNQRVHGPSWILAELRFRLQSARLGSPFQYMLFVVGWGGGISQDEGLLKCLLKKSVIESGLGIMCQKTPHKILLYLLHPN